MNRLAFLFVMELVFLSLVPDASACSRCGLFGNRCKFSSHVAVAPVAVVKQPEVFVVQNNFPQPNGAAILAQQGTGVYGFQAAAQAYTLDPAAVLRQAADLARGAQQLAKDGVDGFNTSASLALQLNSQANDSLARGTAAAMVLNAAGLNQASPSSSQALRIFRGSDGRWQVDQASPDEVSARIEAGVSTKPAPQSPAAIGAGSVIAKKCASCHGLDKAEPAGGLYLDQGQGLDCRQALKAIKSVMSGSMPKDKSQALTPEELTAIVEELTKLGSAE